jgi:hypothetical protein
MEAAVTPSAMVFNRTNVLLKLYMFSGICQVGLTTSQGFLKTLFANPGQAEAGKQETPCVTSLGTKYQPPCQQRTNDIYHAVCNYDQENISLAPDNIYPRKHPNDAGNGFPGRPEVIQGEQAQIDQRGPLAVALKFRQ